MRQDRSFRRGVRANALWGRRGESRSNALWGSGKRGMIMLALAAMLVVPVAGSASSTKSDPGAGGAVVPSGLLAQAAANPLQMFDVIVQGDKSSKSADVSAAVAQNGGNAKRSFMTVTGVQATLSGQDLLKPARHPHVTSITADAPVRVMAYEDSTMWMDSTDMTILQNAFDPATGEITGPAPQAPAIAVVDSGVEARSDFRSRVVSLCRLLLSLSGNSPDG